MTLLSVAQDIIRETKNPIVPGTIIGNTSSVSAQQALAALTNSIKGLARDYDWQELVEENTFTSVASQEGYDVPSDFDRFLNNTFWNVDTNRICQGPMDAPQWRVLKNSTTGAGASFDYFRIRKNKVEIYPTPTATIDYVYEYITNLIVESSGGTGQTTWLADTDVPKIDEYILQLDATWRFLDAQGMPYAQEKQLAEKAIKQKLSVNGGRRTIYHSPRFSNGRVGYPHTVTAP